MHSDPLLVRLVTVIVAALICGWLLNRLRQPAIIGYILAGVVLGPQLLGLIPDRQIFHFLGQIGLMFLLFYIGAEINIKRLLKGWKISVLGCILQVMLNIGFCFLIGLIFHWSVKMIVFIGFITSLSSTAVVLKILEERKALDSIIGKHCLGILLVQDFAVIPMLIILSFFDDKSGISGALPRQLVGLGLIAFILFWLIVKGKFPIPMWLIGQNHDFRVLAGLMFCLGSALVSGVLGLSAELGAFVAGVVLGSTEEGGHIKEFVNPFKVFFVCIFFVSIGLLFDLNFFISNLGAIVALVFFVLVMKSLINAGILTFLGVDWLTAVLTGTMLSQIGEFSFLLAAAAISGGIIESYGYQMTISVIVLTLMFTPLWIRINRRMLKYSTGSGGTVRFQSVTKEQEPLINQGTDT
jgi:CPA2 family monovalent cation:H+ antiporter-2